MTGADLLFVAVIIAFFGISFAGVILCDKLK
jgi:hypothetical protein